MKKNITEMTTAARSMRCPRCQKRAFDVTGNAGQPVSIQLKCPHCKNIVTVDLPTELDRAS